METQQQQNEGEHYIYLHGILQLRLLHTYNNSWQKHIRLKTNIVLQKKGHQFPSSNTR